MTTETPPTPGDDAPPAPMPGAGGATVKSTLKFSQKTHRYFLDKRPIPGVTTLIGKGLPKPAIPYWAARSVAEYVIRNPEGVEQLRTMGEGPAIAALKQVPWQARDDAAVRGTDVHALAESILHGEEVTVPDHYIDHVHGYVDFLEEFDVTPIWTERPVINRQWWYAGTGDALVKFGRGPWAGYTILQDNKTSSGVYGETGLQCAAYARAEAYVDQDWTETPMPVVDATGVCHITDAGTQFYPLSRTPEEIDTAFKLFTHIQHVAKRADWIKELVGEPMQLTDAVA